MYTIRVVKSWYGSKYAIVDKNGDTIISDRKVMQFPQNKEGLALARKYLSELKG